MQSTYTTSRKTKWEKGDTAAFLLDTAKRFPVLSDAEQASLILQMVQPGQAGKNARDKMVLHNLRLVVRPARSYWKAIEPHPGILGFEDFLILGYCGLIKAAARFKPEKGCKFSTYAMWWIRQEMSRGIDLEHRLVRIPYHLCEKVTRIKKFAQEYSAKTGSLPSSEQLEFVTYKGPANGRPSPASILQLFQPTFSLDKAVVSGESGCDTFESLRPSNLPLPEDEVYRSQQREYLEDLFRRAELSDMERRVITLRYGEDGCSHKEISKLVEVSQSDVHVILARVLRKLRRIAFADPFGLEVA